MKKIEINSSESGFLGLLTLVFITLKLTGLISWKWLWVLSPIWIPLALVILGLIVFSIFYLNKN